MGRGILSLAGLLWIETVASDILHFANILKFDTKKSNLSHKTGLRIFPKLGVKFQDNNGHKLTKSDFARKILFVRKSTKTVKIDIFICMQRNYQDHDIFCDVLRYKMIFTINALYFPIPPSISRYITI